MLDGGPDEQQTVEESQVSPTGIKKNVCDQITRVRGEDLDLRVKREVTRSDTSQDFIQKCSDFLKEGQNI